MAIRFFITKRDRKGERYYWQVPAYLKAFGWKTEALPADKESAMEQAIRLNAELDAWKIRNPDVKPAQNVRPAPARQGTIDAVIDEYRASRKFREIIAPTTRANYELRFKYIVEAFGGEQVNHIRPEHVAAFYDALLNRFGVFTANEILKVFSILMSQARDDAAFLFKKVNKVKAPSRTSVWTPEAAEAFLRVAEAERPSMALAFRLAIAIGQRQGDILTLKWSDYRDGKIRLVQNKTKAAVCVEVYGKTKEMLDTAPKRSLFVIASEETGFPYKRDNFKHVFARLKAKAQAQNPHIDFSDLKFIDLRRTAAVRMAESGCTAFELSAVTGHNITKSQKILEVYCPRSDAMAHNAIEKLKRKYG